MLILRISIFVSMLASFITMSSCKEDEKESELQVWNGSKIIFTKEDGADWTLADNQDHLTAQVVITRADKKVFLT